MEYDGTRAAGRLPGDGPEVLGETEALALAATVPIGRVVYSRHALPAVHVVNFAIDGRNVVFRTPKGCEFSAAVTDTVVAVEVDRIDEAAGHGWTVTLTGRSRLVTDPVERERLLALRIAAWTAPSESDYVIRVRIQMISGRRLQQYSAG